MPKNSDLDDQLEIQIFIKKKAYFITVNEYIQYYSILHHGIDPM